VNVYVSVAVARSAVDAPFTEGLAEKAEVLPQMARMSAEAVANFMVRFECEKGDIGLAETRFGLCGSALGASVPEIRIPM
jgi:hypothetical protein